MTRPEPRLGDCPVATALPLAGGSPGGDSYTEPDFASAALVTIDVQRDVLDGGPLQIPGTSSVLLAMQMLAAAFRGAGRPVVHVVRLYCADGANVDICRRESVVAGLRVLTPGTDGSQLASELLPDLGLTLDAPLLLAGGIQRLARGEHELAAIGVRLMRAHEVAEELRARMSGVGHARARRKDPAARE